MFFQNINYLSIVIAAVISAVAGFLWYSPWLFGNIWMRHMKITSDEADKTKNNMTTGEKIGMYAGPLVLALVSSFIMAGLLNSLVVVSVSGLALLGFLVWFGFSMPVSMTYKLFGNDDMTLFAINSGFQLVSTILIALIIGIWG